MATPFLVLAAALLIVLVVADLLWSPGYVRRVRAAVVSGDLQARTRMYRLTVALAWTATALALTVLLGGGLSRSEIGFRWPTADSLERYGSVLASVLVGLLAGTVIAVIASRRGRSTRPVGDIDVLLPRTASERRWYAVVAVTAGTTEEVFYRALALTVLTAVLPDAAAVGAAAVVFALAHAYQGVAGMLVTGLLAVGLGAVYLATGSLLPGMVLHVMLDLRILAVRRPPALLAEGGGDRAGPTVRIPRGQTGPS